MRGNRSIFVGLSALVLAVGMLGANGYLWWLAQSGVAPAAAKPAPKNDAPRWPIVNEKAIAAETAEPSLWHSPFRALYHEPDGGSPQIESARRFFPHEADSFEIAEADDSDVPPARADKSSQPPRLLPDVAVPIEPAPPADWLSRLIEAELPGVSAEERRVWSQELQGFEPEVVRDILRMKRNVGGSPQGRIGLLPNWTHAPEPVLPPDAGLVPPPLDDLSAEEDSVANRLEPSLRALELARDVVLNNLANLNTVGFKRSRVLLSPLPAQILQESDADTKYDRNRSTQVAVGFGVELASTPVDLSQGPLKKTDQPLDVAIEGAGFFPIQGQTETLYARCGQFLLDEEGRLCLLVGQMLRPVLPVIRIPANAGAVRIAQNGEVTGEPKAGVLGRLELVRFQNPGGLQQRSGQLFAASKTSGPPQTGIPQGLGWGSLRQGMLEQSNVSRDQELEEFQRLQSHWQLLKDLAGQGNQTFLPPVARQPANRTQRASADALPPASLSTLKVLGNQGRDLIEDYLQSERMRSIKRTLGLQKEDQEDHDLEWCKKYFESEKARSIERNLGLD
jgi:flagellar basal-body rod protein FlgG